MNLGAALMSLGGTENLKEAIGAYRAALEEGTRARTPLQWAMNENDLGVALNALGKQENSPDRLREATDAYRAALEEYSAERAPLPRARTLMNLGNALQSLSRYGGGPGLLEEALAGYRQALQLDPVSLDQANVRFNIGVALVSLGRPQEALPSFEKAAAVFQTFGMTQRASMAEGWIASLGDVGNTAPSGVAPVANPKSGPH